MRLVPSRLEAPLVEVCHQGRLADAVRPDGLGLLIDGLGSSGRPQSQYLVHFDPTVGLLAVVNSIDRKCCLPGITRRLLHDADIDLPTHLVLSARPHQTLTSYGSLRVAPRS